MELQANETNMARSSEQHLSVPSGDIPLGSALLMISEGSHRATWESLLAATKGLNVVFQVASGEGPLSPCEYDAVAIDISAAAGGGLGWGLSLAASMPAAEIILFCESNRSPEVAALRALGWQKFVSGPTAREWIIKALPSFVRIGRARRALRCAERDVPPYGRQGCDDNGAPTMPLTVAEGRFRESYIRALLLRSGSRTAAAKEAGIPYRTFCKMLQKLNMD
jgi:hypothetical protein